MRRNRLWRATMGAALMLACGVAAAQSVPQPAPSASSGASQPTLAPAQGTGAPATQPPGAAAQPPQPLTSSPAPLPPLNSQVPGTPLTAGTGQPMAASGQPMTPSGTPTRSDPAQDAFRALDPMNRGFVTRTETDKIDGFTGFDNADTNRDGRLTPEEFFNAWKNFAR